MTIDEAIKILTHKYRGDHTKTDPDLGQAIALSIEALKRTTTRRETLSWTSEPLLPGETTKKPSGEASPNGEPLSSPQQAEGYPAE